jgi:hypothetical protein
MTKIRKSEGESESEKGYYEEPLKLSLRILKGSKTCSVS